MGDSQAQCRFKGECFPGRKVQECWEVFVSIQILYFLNGALECYTNQMGMEMKSFFVWVTGELDIAEICQ